MKARRVLARRGAAATLALLGGWFAISLAIASCTDADEGIHGAVHGTVRDSMTKKPIKGVEVVFVADTLEQADDATDGDGRYAIEVVAASPNGRLTATKAGYETHTVSVFLDDGDVTVDIDLEHE